MGAWGFVQPRVNSLLVQDSRSVKYAGRMPSSSPATGNKYSHMQVCTTKTFARILYN